MNLQIELRPHVGGMFKVLLVRHPATGRPRHVGYIGPGGWSFIQPSGGVRDLTPREKRIVERQMQQRAEFASGLSEQG